MSAGHLLHGDGANRHTIFESSLKCYNSCLYILRWLLNVIDNECN